MSPSTSVLPPNRGNRQGDAHPSRSSGRRLFRLAIEDAPDPIVDGKIDLGALAAEFMILGLDPYPRKPGVVLTGF